MLSATKALKAGVIDSVLAEDTSIYPEDNDSYIVNQIATCVVFVFFAFVTFVYGGNINLLFGVSNRTWIVQHRIRAFSP